MSYAAADSAHVRSPWVARIAVLLVLAAAAGVALTAATSGTDETRAKLASDGTYIDGAIEALESAQALGAVAERLSPRARVRSFAAGMRSRDRLVTQLMASIHMRKFKRPAQNPDGTVVLHDGLSLPSTAEVDPVALRAARPFDRAFLDASIEMRAVLIGLARDHGESGGDEALQALGRELIERYMADLHRMARWRESWFDAPSPALRGLETEADEGMPGMPGMPGM